MNCHQTCIGNCHFREPRFWQTLGPHKIWLPTFCISTPWPILARCMQQLHNAEGALRASESIQVAVVRPESISYHCAYRSAKGTRAPQWPQGPSLIALNCHHSNPFNCLAFLTIYLQGAVVSNCPHSGRTPPSRLLRMHTFFALIHALSMEIQMRSLHPKIS